MLRNTVLAVVFFSFLSNINFAVAARNVDSIKMFLQAQELASKGQITEAITVYNALIIENPLLPEAYNNLAALYLKQKNTDQAKFILEQGLHAHKGYGVLYESLTAINVSMAREAYSKALQIDLKPLSIEIAALPLSQRKSIEKKSIVISKNTPDVKSGVKITSAVKKIQHNKITAKPQKMLNSQNKEIKEIEQVLQAWSAAWSAQAVEIYLSFYHDQYKPSNGLSYNGWVQSRRLRLKKPRWIKVALSNIVTKQSTGKQTVVTFKQTYQSNSLKDISEKKIVLLHTDNGWRIFREINI